MPDRNPLATQTIMGLPVEEIYHVVETKLPNGRVFKQLFQRVYLPDGKEDWQLVDEKLRAVDEARKALEARYAGTGTVPKDWKQPDTEVLDRKDGADRETDATIMAGGITRIDLRRQLVLGLGDERRIIQNKGLDESQIKFFKLHPSTLTLLHQLAIKHGNFRDDKGDWHMWGEVAKLINPPYPDSLPGA